MIFILGGNGMIIKQLDIEALHGLYDYSIHFHDDLTFLYGDNGSGKTTVLNILSAIVTGKLYNLSVYDFRSITLHYSDPKDGTQSQFQVLTNGSSYVLSMSGMDTQEVIEDYPQVFSLLQREDDERAAEMKFMNTYKIPRALRTAFLDVYLPLNRTSRERFDYPDSYSRRRRAIYFGRDMADKNYLNESLRYVESLIRNSYMRIQTRESEVDARFKNSVFTSFLHTDKYTLRRLTDRSANSLQNIEKNHQDYIRLLRSFNALDPNMQQQIDSFFEKYKEEYKKAAPDASGKTVFTMDYIIMDVEFNRIRQIADQAKSIEAEKTQIREPLTTFLDTVNDFFRMGADGKVISISTDGWLKISALDMPRDISLYRLSSGEKQIIILLACLIFGLQDQKGGLYIVDEPEASLHLAWQKIFVTSIRKANSTVQLIFATHAPEIIGSYSDRAVHLEKKINPQPALQEGDSDA